MNSKKNIAWGIAICYFLLAACSKNQAEEFRPEPPETPEEKVTYTAVVGPIFQASCSGCHSPGRNGANAWTFNGFSSVVDNANRIRNVVLVTRRMPLGGSLTAAQLNSIQLWYDQGMAQ